jgi:stearoyl-CoA desaturase (delta-9 desaturase)
MAFFTFGEGYHNFHHEFQHDYRNGVKPWHFDPTKWCVWLLAKLGLASHLRRVPNETILLAEIAEQQRQLTARIEARVVPPGDPVHSLLQAARQRLQQAAENWEQRAAAYRRCVGQQVEVSRETIQQLRREARAASRQVRAAIREWQLTHRAVQARVA